MTEATQYQNAHWDLLSKAARKIKPTGFEEYFALKRLWRSRDPEARQEFQTRFANYYRLHIGGLTPACKRRYLHLLVAFIPRGRKDPYTPLLLDLYRFRRRKGDRSLQVSFVSKLVAFHDESRPIYDRYVSQFFGLSVPSVGPLEFRIAGFLANLQRIQENYQAWATNPRFSQLTRELLSRNSALRTCHPSRLCDFLVWTVGANDIK
jgi:hypothetical protein